MHRRGVFLSRVFCSSGEAPWARQDYARCVWDGGVGPRMGLGREREKDGTTGRGSSLRILPPVGRPQFAPPIWGGRELRLPPHALGAGSGLEGSCPKSQGAAPKLRDSLGAALGVPCRTTSQRAVPDKKMRQKKTLQVYFVSPPGSYEIQQIWPLAIKIGLSLAAILPQGRIGRPTGEGH